MPSRKTKLMNTERQTASTAPAATSQNAYRGSQVYNYTPSWLPTANQNKPSNLNIVAGLARNADGSRDVVTKDGVKTYSQQKVTRRQHQAQKEKGFKVESTTG